MKDGKLKFSLRKQQEGSWSQIFSNGFSYSLTQEFPTNVEDFDLNDLQVLTELDINLKEQLPPMTGELEPLKNTILHLLTVYENLRREWLKENQESLKKSREAGLLEIEEKQENDLITYYEKLWIEAKSLLQEHANDQEKLKDAFEKAKTAADYGNVDALHFVGTAYTAVGDSYGVEKDLESAVKYFKHAVFLHENLQSLLAWIAIEEEASKEDSTKQELVKSLYLKAAQLSHPTAFFRLGLILHEEYETSKDKKLAEEAIEWWKLSLRRGHALSAKNIGSTYLDDLHDLDLAYDYYKLGSEWSDQITIPSQLVNKTIAPIADPDDLLEEVLSSQLRESTQSLSSTTSASSLDASKESNEVTQATVTSTTPTMSGTDDILNKLVRSAPKSSRMTPKRPFSETYSPSPSSPYFREDDDEEEEVEEEEVREAGFLWKASSWILTLAVSGGAFYLLKGFLVPPTSQQAKTQSRGIHAPSIAGLTFP